MKWLYELLYKAGILWRFRCQYCGGHIYDLFKTDGELRLITHERQCEGE